MALVNTVKECDESEAIEKTILDRTSTIDRILLPLYISHKTYGNKLALSTTEIAKILAELGTPVSAANVAHGVAGSARAYVIGDKIRKRGGKGSPVKYRINRKGINYLSAVISESST